MNKKLNSLFSDKNLKRLAIAVIIIGIVLRFIFYLQNRCLFIDEANVARNIFERGFLQLTAPLNYEQYAPPLFLWVVKCFTMLFGYSEFSFRLYSLLCGVAALWLMYVALGKYTNNTSRWYPLFLFATGFIYIRYSAELKQYMSDVVVILSLLLSALYFDVLQTQKVRFTVIWAIIGSVSIWLSMPSVFMLSGVMAYHFYNSVSQKKYTALLPLACIGIIWLFQFALYYTIILKPQIHSDFLQNCHKDFFLYAFPSTFEKLDHDADVLIKVLSAMGGKWTISIGFHMAALAAGIIFLFSHHKAKLLLVISPVILVIVAAAMNQYALTPRLVLFIMPLLLIVVAAGLQQMLQIRFIAVRILLVGITIICMANFSTFSLLYKRFDNEEITRSLSFVQKEKITASHLYIRDLAGPAYIYYTTIHPSRNNWQDLAYAHILPWNCNYDSLARSFTGKNALLYSWAPENEIDFEQTIFRKYCHLVAKNTVTGGITFIYEK